MNVFVCIKQVPASSLPVDSFGNLRRECSGGQLNPSDAYALEAALQIAEQTGGKVTALTMGPSSAETVLRTALSMGASRAVLLSDGAFAGADVYGTSYTLSEAIGRVGIPDVIVCGEQTTDGDTGQLPGALAAQLGIPVYGWVKKLKIEKDRLVLQQELSLGTQQVIADFPCLLAVGKQIGRPRIPNLRNQLRARKADIEVWKLEDLPDRNASHYGRAGSPTRVTETREIHRVRKQDLLTLEPTDAAQCILNRISEGGNHV